MGSGGGAYIRGLVAEDIGHCVQQAIEKGESISAAGCIARVRERYPNINMSDAELAEEVAIAAAAAGVKLEPDQRPEGMPSGNVLSAI